MSGDDSLPWYYKPPSTSDFNATLDATILITLYKSVVSSVVPSLLLESFTIGALFACVPIASYLLWIKSPSFSRVPYISTLWIFMTLITVRWALSLKQLESTLAGRPLGISLTLEALLEWRVTSAWVISGEDTLIESYASYGEAWQYLLILLTETVLFGVSTSLFVVVAYTTFRPINPVSTRRSCIVLVVPIMASCMYCLSLGHWIIMLESFNLRAAEAAPDTRLFSPSTPPFNPVYLNIALSAAFSLNAVLSDTIVLWRLCAVWEKRRPVIAFGLTLSVVILGLNVANVGINAHEQIDFDTVKAVNGNSSDSEFIATYGSTAIGLAAAFISLGSNLCATILVGVKAGIHRRRFRYFENAPRTRTQRFMELLVESGAIYSLIWILYCVSFYQRITVQGTLAGSQTDTSDALFVTAESHLDAAMAQITSIYPLMIFILVALNKIHHDRGPESLRHIKTPQLWAQEIDRVDPETSEMDASQIRESSEMDEAKLTAQSAISLDPLQSF
ncbi:unnamed protein product [Peniophora sp. CBMAI 1063]|nr:unnamed protein product [Peniophora sp. CBMAI 1063]